ncbi:MAG: FAD-binding domain-containing protein, partial [Actinomycetes bacterium]
AAVSPPASEGAAAFRRQLAFREFYADLVAHRPGLARQSLDSRWDRLVLDAGPDSDRRLAAWQQGTTGYPMVDAGMRQMLATGWMHNRVRMLTASFLVKDLHLDWRVGARWFMRCLVDADLASNSQGWQWVAGAGTDAAPYFRVFNPTTQGKKFDPDGSYVRRWIPELRDVPRNHVHEPWLDPHGYDHGYPHRIVDHATERTEALTRWSAT